MLHNTDRSEKRLRQAKGSKNEMDQSCPERQKKETEIETEKKQKQNKKQTSKQRKEKRRSKSDLRFCMDARGLEPMTSRASGGRSPG